MLDSQLAEHRDRLADLLSFARLHTPYYQKVIPPGIEELVLDGQHWQQVPVLSKRRVQANWASFLSNPDVVNDPAFEILMTSGSTGMPLKIARPKLELRKQAKRLWSARRRWHPEIMRWKLLLLTLYTEPRSRKSSQVMSLLNLGSGGKGVDVSFSALTSYMDLIEDYEPDWVYGCPSVMYRLAQCYRREQRSIPTLKLIEVSGEQLHAYQRDLLEEVFNCPVVNIYGCREFWVLSYECPHRSMHAWTDDLLLEVIQDGRPVSMGEAGELVVTSLTNRAMPLIRYELGDLVRMTPSECSCGDPRPVLTPVGGRTSNLIITRGKTVVSGTLDILFAKFIQRHEGAFIEYRVVQLDYDHLEINLVPGPSFEEATTQELRKAIHQLLPSVHCEFVLCSNIPNLPCGKNQTFVSRVSRTEVNSACAASYS